MMYSQVVQVFDCVRHDHDPWLVLLAGLVASAVSMRPLPWPTMPYAQGGRRADAQPVGTCHHRVGRLHGLGDPLHYLAGFRAGHAVCVQPAGRTAVLRPLVDVNESNGQGPMPRLKALSVIDMALTTGTSTQMRKRHARTMLAR